MVSRRQALFGLGATLLAAPFVDLLAGRKGARADGGKIAKRLIVFFSPNGTVHSHWRPTATGDFAVGSILEPLTAIKSKINVLDGIDFYGFDNHEPGMAGMLTGQGTAGNEGQGASVDQYIASKIGGDSRFASLELGVQTSAWGENRQTRMCYAAGGAYVPPEDKPGATFKRLFGAATTDPGAMDAVAKNQKSVLDILRADIADLRVRVGAEEKVKLDEHLDALRTTEKGLFGGGGAISCTTPTAPAIADPYAMASFPDVGKAQMDLLVTALACGQTRVGSIQFSHTVSPAVFSWLGISEGHHELSHKDDGNVAGVADFVKAERWYAEQFAYLVKKLDETKDPTTGGTLLDDTLVVWSKELGDGRLHDAKSVPFILAGSAGGRFKTGRTLKLDHVPHQKLLVAICQAMGLTNTTFGNPAHGTGALELA
jgi:hypothetical protein